MELAQGAPVSHGRGKAIIQDFEQGSLDSPNFCPFYYSQIPSSVTKVKTKVILISGLTPACLSLVREQLYLYFKLIAKVLGFKYPC